MSGNMTDSKQSESEAQTQNQNRKPYQSVSEDDDFWLCCEQLQEITSELEDNDQATESIIKHLRDAQISLQKAKNERKEALIFDRVHRGYDLSVQPYEIDERVSKPDE
jgi:hypothetical protein